MTPGQLESPAHIYFMGENLIHTCDRGQGFGYAPRQWRVRRRSE